ncbi:MAG TPA: tripartite tricarboxylate transporter substrate-binding protein [Xanthobacteraceae bacterium]|jgi:tripartite-type tricarboxylate transporter receptor subunit TctC|nr:tripartite tricarboxylate transporter substrate-binding protein [Xanthobacteraceae bacterium]
MTKAASWVATVGACVIALLAGVLNPALAEKPFYEGKTITLSSYGGAGNNYDTYSRLVSRHLGKHIPGHPNIIVMNQPGAGGLVAANYTSRIAPQDGTFITLVSDGLLMFEATGRKGLQDSLTKFKWLAALSSSNVVTATWAGSHIKTIDDARKREVRLGGSGAGAMSSVVPELYNSFAGTRFTVVQGYRSAPEQNLAMERGELDGRGAASWTSFKNLMPNEIKDGKLNVIAQIGTSRASDLPDAPLLTELAGSDPKKQAIAQFVSKALTLSRSVAAPPHAPDAQVEILRKGFADLVKDPEFLAEADRLHLDIGFVPGPEVGALIKDVLSTPKDVIDETKVMMKL